MVLTFSTKDSLLLKQITLVHLYGTYGTFILVLMVRQLLRLQYIIEHISYLQRVKSLSLNVFNYMLIGKHWRH